MANTTKSVPIAAASTTVVSVATEERYKTRCSWCGKELSGGTDTFGWPQDFCWDCYSEFEAEGYFEPERFVVYKPKPMWFTVDTLVEDTQVFQVSI